MSYHQCCVPGCVTTSGGENALHAFPNPALDLERFKMWLFYIGGDILKLTNEYIYKNRRVCHIHFENRHLCRHNRISNIAVPTLNMPGLSPLKFTHIKPKEQQPLSQIQNLPENKPSTSKEDFSMDVDMACVSSPVIKTSNEESMPSNLMEIDNNTPETRKPLPVFATRKRNSSKMTQVEKDLYSKLVTVKRKLSKYKNNLKKKAFELKSATRLASNPGFLKVMSDLPKAAKILTLLQFREFGKRMKGRRFKLDEKIIALSIMKQSPKAYRFLRRIFLLPSPQTLIKLIQTANLKPGINEKIFSQLKKKAMKMKDEEKLCILIFDEMALMHNVTYNERKDKVTGFVTNGRETQQILAKHAQVFMIRGLIKNYKQTVSYTFSAGATKGKELSVQIKELIKEIKKTGLQVVATVCDQGTNNRQAIKCLIEESKGTCLRQGNEPKPQVFIVDNNEIVAIYDPPHLLKGLRNNLLNKNLQFEMDGVIKTAKWEHLELFHRENPGYKGIRLVPKITDAHIIRHKVAKMKVKYASQVFSATLASNMGYLAEKLLLPPECKDTADLLLIVDKLFDSVNGNYKNNKRFAKPLLGPVTPNSVHHNVWNNAKKILKSMVFINKHGKRESVPTIANWVWTLEGIETLLKKLKNEHNITSIWMRHLNQDPIENFFGAIRSHGCRNTNPTPAQFESAYTTLLVNSLTSVHTPGGNCEKDFGETLFALVVDEQYKASDGPSNCGTEIDLNQILEINLESLESKKGHPKIMAPLIYVSGYFVHKTKKIYKNCITCKSSLVSEEEIEYMHYREYEGRRWLCSPSESVVDIISQMQDITMAIIKQNLEKENIKLYIKTVTIILVNFGKLKLCHNHEKKLLDYLINLVIRFFLFNYCKSINRILCGNLNVIDENDNFQLMAKDIYRKSMKMKR